jgi:D-alanine-D-alanine ligase
MEKKTIALISGGISSEREVSLNSGKQVYDALDKNKYDIVTYDPQTDIPRLVADAAGIDCALIILHGPYGEDGTVQGLLDLLDIPYQGAGVLGSSVAMNKLLSKGLYERAGLKVPSYSLVRRGETVDVDGIVTRLGLPLVVKPVETGSSVGMSIVRTEASLADAVEKALTFGSTAMVEANTIPGMTATSLFPQSARAAGMSFGGLLDRLIELGMAARRRQMTRG